MKPTKLTAVLLKQLPAGEIVRDTVVKGLFAERNASGVSLKIQADLWQGERGKRTLVRTVRMTLGKHPEMSIDDARSAAMAELAKIKRGLDPRAPTGPAPGELTVGKMFAAYVANMRINQRAERSISDIEYMLSKYLVAWTDKPVLDIKPSVLAAEHARITREHGKLVANKAVKAFGAAYKLAGKQADDKGLFADNPIRGVTFHPNNKREVFISAKDLPKWAKTARALPRAVMHELGLFSGLRPGVLVSIEKSWIQLENRAIVIPKSNMKSRREFALPLSAYMIELVKRALEQSEKLETGSPWLFPTRSADGKEVICTQAWKETKLPQQTGHVLRHSYRVHAKNAGVADVDAELLLDHKIPGVQGVYLHATGLFEHLLREQEKVSAHLLSIIPVPKEPETETDTEAK